MMWRPRLSQPRKPARGLNLALVVDDSPSMMLWEEEVRTFVGQLNQLGIFRRIRPYRLDTRSPAGPVLYGDTAHSSARDPAALRDRSGRRVLLVITDTVGACWRPNLV